MFAIQSYMAHPKRIELPVGIAVSEVDPENWTAG